MRGNADEYMSQFGEYTQLAGKSVRSLFYDGQKGTRDPVFEFVDYMNGRLHAIVIADEVWRDDVLVNSERDFIDIIPRLIWDC